MLLVTLLFIFAIVIYFVDIPGIEADIPLIAVILSFIIAPILAFCTFGYFKEIFNTNPILTINQVGTHEQINTYSVGMIRLEDIKDIGIRPYSPDTYLIGIVLKEPEKYIKNKKLLARLNKQQSVKRWGHIRITSLYFKKELNDVINIIQYCFAQYYEQ